MLGLTEIKIKDESMLNWCRSIICMLFAISILITHTLWDRIDRTIPSYPIFDLGLTSNSILFILLTILFLLSLVLGTFNNTSKYGLTLSLIIWFFFVSQDLNCFQPSFYFFATILAIYELRRLKLLDSVMVYFSLIIMLSSTYFFGGLNKINPVYYETVFLWMTQNFSEKFKGDNIQLIFHTIGTVSPYIEALIGIGLLFPLTRKLAALSAISMHLFILLCLGPWGQNFNHVIFPWNIALIFINAILYFYNQFSKITWDVFKNKILLILLVLNWLVPVFHFWEIGDSYLAHDLYSGKAYFGFIILPNESGSKLPHNIGNKFKPYNVDKIYTNLTEWSISELSVPIYPEKRILFFYKKWFEEHLEKNTPVELIIYSQKKYETFK